MGQLGDQLGAIRSDWRPTATLVDPEGFDRAVAEPLAEVFKAIREQYEARLEKLNDAYRRARDAHEQTEHLLMDSWTEEERLELYDALRDVSRGVFTFKEVMEKWEIE